MFSIALVVRLVPHLWPPLAPERWAGALLLAPHGTPVSSTEPVLRRGPRETCHRNELTGVPGPGVEEEGGHSLDLQPAPVPLRKDLPTPLPVRGAVVAVVGKEVKVQLPEDMQGDAAVRG